MSKLATLFITVAIAANAQPAATGQPVLVPLGGILAESPHWGSEEWPMFRVRDVCQYHGGPELAFDTAIVLAWVAGHSGYQGAARRPDIYWAIVGPDDLTRLGEPAYIHVEVDYGDPPSALRTAVSELYPSAKYVCTSRAGETLLQQQETERVHRSATDFFAKVWVFRLDRSLELNEPNLRFLLQACPPGPPCG